jgi:predicted alternative tryptophan synthase beta-subunit
MTGGVGKTGDSRLRGNDGNWKSSVVLCVFSVKLRVIFFVTQSFTEKTQRHTEMYVEYQHTT